MELSLGLSLSAIAVRQGGGGAHPLRTVATENALPTSAETQAGLTRQAGRWHKVIGQDTRDLVLSYTRWAINVAIASGDMTVLEASITYNGVTVPVTKSGGRSLVVQRNVADVQFDPVPASAFGVSFIPRGAIIWIKQIIEVASGVVIPMTPRQASHYTGGQNVWLDPAVTTLSSTDVDGVYTSTGTAPTARTFGCIPMLLGHAVNDDPSYFVFGNSISQANFLHSANPNLNGTGIPQRAMTDADGSSNAHPSINIAKTGLAYSHYLDGSTSDIWRVLVKYCRFAIDGMGTNDITQPKTLSEMQAYATQLYGVFDEEEIERVGAMNIPPRTTSTDNWATAANQTINSGYGAGELAEQFNAWRATQVFDIAPLLTFRNVANSYVWETNGVAFYGTDDGTHPSAAFEAIGAVEYRALMQSLAGSRVYEAESLAIFTAMTTPPSTVRKALIDDFVKALKASGDWAELDALWVIAAANSQAGYLNWKNPGSLTLVASGGPTFTADRGVKGDLTDARLAHGYNANTFSGAKFTLNLATVGLYMRQAPTGTAAQVMLSHGTTRIGVNSGNTQVQVRLNDSASANVAATSVGHYMSKRTGASARLHFKNGTQVLSDSAAATSIGTVTGTDGLLSVANSLWSDAEISAAYFGGNVNPTTMDAALLAYLTAVGAAV